MPAQGEILIYTKSMNCFEAMETDPGIWDVYDGSRKGFLIIDVEYDLGRIVGINQAVQLDFWKNDYGKWYSQYHHNFDYERIVDKDTVYLVLEDFYTDEDLLIFMFRGKTKVMNIGLGKDEKREIPRSLEGSIIEYYDVDFLYKRMCCASLRLSSNWTRQANDPDIGNQDFEYAENEIVKYWLLRHGYNDDGQGDGIIDGSSQDDDEPDDGDQDDGDDNGDDGDEDDEYFPSGVVLF
jgi:hypothetical protein